MSLRLHSTMFVLAAFAVPTVSGEDAAGDSRATRGFLSKRFSFGVMAGASLAPARTRSTTEHPSPGVFAEFDQGPGLPPLRVTTTSARQIRFGSVSPIVSAFAEMRLGRGFSLQASLSGRLLPTTVTSETRFGEPKEQHSFAVREKFPRTFLEMPAIVTYRFETAKWRPFFGFGPTFRILKDRWHEPRYGAVAAFGFDLLRARRWALTPQVRYTRWTKVGHPRSAPRTRVQALVAVVF